MKSRVDEKQPESQSNITQKQQQSNDKPSSTNGKDDNINCTNDGFSYGSVSEESVRGSKQSVPNTSSQCKDNISLFPKSDVIIQIILKGIENGEIGENSNWSDIVKKTNKGTKEKLITELKKIEAFGSFDFKVKLKESFLKFKKIIEEIKNSTS